MEKRTEAEAAAGRRLAKKQKGGSTRFAADAHDERGSMRGSLGSGRSTAVKHNPLLGDQVLNRVPSADSLDGRDSARGSARFSGAGGKRKHGGSQASLTSARKSSAKSAKLGQATPGAKKLDDDRRLRKQQADLIKDRKRARQAIAAVADARVKTSKDCVRASAAMERLREQVGRFLVYKMLYRKEP